MTNPEFSIERRDAVLKSAREIAEKAKADGRELTAAPSERSGGALPIGAAPEHLREQIARDIARIGSLPKPDPVEQVLPHAVSLDPHRRAEARAEIAARRPADPPADEAPTVIEAADQPTQATGTES